MKGFNEKKIPKKDTIYQSSPWGAYGLYICREFNIDPELRKEKYIKTTVFANENLEEDDEDVTIQPLPSDSESSDGEDNDETLVLNPYHSKSLLKYMLVEV